MKQTVELRKDVWVMVDDISTYEYAATEDITIFTLKRRGTYVKAEGNIIKRFNNFLASGAPAMDRHGNLQMRR